VLGHREAGVQVDRLLILDQIQAICLCRVPRKSPLRADGLEEFDRVLR
jgi:hypothetical protein